MAKRRRTLAEARLARPRGAPRGRGAALRPGGKILTRRRLVRRIQQLRRAGKRIVFTNGCFDLLHPGHVRCLQQAKRLGDVLVVGVNTDASVRRLKGPTRPLLPLRARCEMLAALEAVDYVTAFREDTPLPLIRAVQPDVLVKGGDWAPEAVVGAEIVRRRGGRVRCLPLLPGFSTSALLQRAAAACEAERSAPSRKARPPGGSRAPRPP